VRRSLSLIPLVVLLAVLTGVPLPLFEVGPGPAREVEPLIHVRGPEVFDSAGRFLLTTVTVSRATSFEAVRGWFDRSIDIVPERDVLPPGITEQENDEIQLSEMDASKLAAAYVTLQRVSGYPADHRPGALVQDVFPDFPADGRLFPGDLVLEANGEPVAGRAALAAAIRRAGADGRLTLTVRAGGETRTVVVRPVRAEGVDHAVIGVSLIDNFPFSLSIESGDIGGPSAGLMWALGLSDLLTPGDLAGGRVIAGTGTIDLDGAVGPIGGIEQKVVAAARAGADVFLVPRRDLAGARAVVDGLELVPVDTYADALAYLFSGCRCDRF